LTVVGELLPFFPKILYEQRIAVFSFDVLSGIARVIPLERARLHASLFAGDCAELGTTAFFFPVEFQTSAEPPPSLRQTHPRNAASTFVFQCRRFCEAPPLCPVRLVFFCIYRPPPRLVFSLSRDRLLPRCGLFFFFRSYPHRVPCFLFLLASIFF